MPFVVPPQFHRNSADVIALAPPADTGATLIDYMARRLGRRDLSGVDILDMGCGTRFTDTLVNRDVAFGTYTGIDVWVPLVKFLRDNVHDPRFAFHAFDARNPMYSPEGTPLTARRVLPVGERRFDLICMFSVITHQLPADAQMLFTILRKVVRPDGRMFFSVYIDDTIDTDYAEYVADSPTGLSTYTSAHIQRLLDASGWRVESVAGPNPEDLPMFDSYLCAPAE
ncbi:MAG: class I SAM-dependent methyltransferase [Arenimonas sp.]